MAAVSLSGAAEADEILLRPEISALQYVAVYLNRMPPPVQKEWASISETGKALLTREVGAVAVSISDSGTWSFRVSGQNTTARYALTNKKQVSSDEPHVAEILGSDKVREILSIFSEPPPTASEDVAIRSFESKLKLIDEGSRNHRFDSEETDALLEATGRQMSSYDRPVVEKLLLEPSVSKLAQRAESIAGTQEANRARLIKNFAASDLGFAGFSVPGSAVLSQQKQVGAFWPSAVSTIEKGGSKITVSEVKAPSGVLVLKCRGERERCISPDGTVRGSEVSDEIFLPDIRKKSPR